VAGVPGVVGVPGVPGVPGVLGVLGVLGVPGVPGVAAVLGVVGVPAVGAAGVSFLHAGPRARARARAIEGDDRVTHEVYRRSLSPGRRGSRGAPRGKNRPTSR
jgi:hypothetical protein